MFETIEVQAEYINYSIKRIGVDNIKSIVPYIKDGGLWYHVCYVEEKRSAAAAMFL